MADIDVVYTLTTPGGTVLFNDGTQSSSGLDELRILDIQGLDGAPIRAPVDDMPFGHGGLDHNFWEGPRHIQMDGIFLIVSVVLGDGQRPIRNKFEEDLRVALRSIAALQIDSGTLTWTPDGQSARTLVVRHENQFTTGRGNDNYTETFSFGLLAADPDWDGWSS